MSRVHHHTAAIAAALIAIAGCGGADNDRNAATAPNGAADASSQQMPGAPRQSAPPGSGRGLPAGSIRLHPVQIMDPNGFERPMPAATILIPPDWRARGGVVWTPQSACGPGYTINWSAASPDGSTSVAIFPGRTWSANNFGAPQSDGCPTSSINSVRAYLESVAQQARPGARILDYRPREDIAKDFQQLNQSTPTAVGQMRNWVEAGEVLIGYSENGRQMRETLAALAIFSESRMQGAYPGQTMVYLSGQALPGFAMRAPDGQLDFRVAEAIRRTIQPAPEWQARINAHGAATAQIRAKGAADRSAIISQTGREIADIQRQSWEQQQASQDRVARERSEAIRGVETYADPTQSTGEVQLSNQYDNAWRLNDGTYVLTDDPSFNPYAATGQSGVKLEPQQ